MTDTDRTECQVLAMVDKLLNGQMVSQEWMEQVAPGVEHGKPIMLITIDGDKWKARAQLERIGKRYMVQKLTIAARAYLEADLSGSADSKKAGKGA